MAFEAHARRVAEALWGLQPGDVQPHHYTGRTDVTEIDGIARTAHVTHLLMVTTSTKLDKVKADVKKLNAAERVEFQPGIPCVKWLLSEVQLDAQHVALAKQNSVNLMTLNDFQRRFFDGHSYLEKRKLAAFGSARNLVDGTVSISEDEYVPLPVRVQEPANSGTRSPPSSSTVADIAMRLRNGDTVVLLGPFGAGKSLTTREVFFQLRKPYLRDQSRQAPVALNLREHWGQDFADEILERHARSIGFTPKEHLTAAWRAGLVTVLIDGFDEVASQVIAETTNLRFMREARHSALSGLRDLVMKTPTGVGVLICGRDHYFDNEQELTAALGLGSRPYAIALLDEFTEEQAQEYLRKHGIPTALPDWLPRKPLLLGYLARRSLLQAVVQIDGSSGFGFVWDQFLQLICRREAEHERAVMDPDTVRRVLEHLACMVRSTSSGTGPITGPNLAEAYRVETGQLPAEGVLMQLQRLPGLTERGEQGAMSSRSFVDEDMLCALQGSAVARIILESSPRTSSWNWLDVLPKRAVAMAAHLVGATKADAATVISRAKSFAGGQASDQQLAADTLMVALELARESGAIDCRGLRLEGACIGALDLEDLVITGLSLVDCDVREILLGDGATTSDVHIVGGAVHRMIGAASREAVPTRIVADATDIGVFEDMGTNAAVLRLDLSAPLKALVTVLRKLYLQVGGGRKLGALKRGMPNGPVQDAVDGVLRILEAEGVVSVQNGIAHSVRRQRPRIHRILDAPGISVDSIVAKVRELA